MKSLDCRQPPITRRRLRRRAFSLIDLIAAILVIAIAFPPLFLAITDAERNRVDPIQLSRARWLATEKIEDVIADRHSSTRGYSYVVGGNYSSESAVAGFPGFSRSVSVSETGSSLSGSGTGYKTVIVTVQFTGAGGSVRSLSLATVLTDYTP